MNDGESLRSYSEAGDEKAFRDLVGRHSGMVYSTALRRTGEAHAAEDVTQAVFCLLLRKAGRLYGVPDLAPWLHRATCWKASEQLRAERRRQFHEHAAARMNEFQNPADDRWSELAPHLDENLNRLNAADRRLILLRYFRRLSLREVGAAFGVSEDAVRMRIGRALERLRRKLSGLVPTVAASAALDELLMARAAEPAPAPLVARIAAGVRMPGVATSVAANLPVHWTGRIFTLKVGTAVVVLLCAVNMALWFHNDRNDTGSMPAGTAPAAAVNSENAVRIGGELGRGSGFRPATVARARDIEIQLERLRKILESEVRDDSWPPSDLRQCVHDLTVEPQAALAVLLEAIRDPSSRPATRERAVWGLWLLGEESPAMVPEFLPRLAGIIGSPDEPELWWHAADVIRHLGTPENSVSLVAEALSANPAAGYSTLRFWESATRRQPAEVSAAVRPWLELEDPLRFCAAYALALVEGERLEALLPVLADGLRDDLRQHHVLELLEQLGPAASVLAPELAELLVEAEREGLVSFRGRLVEALASVSPESRTDWPEVDRYLRTKEEAENLERKIVDDSASMEELVAGLKNPRVSWMAALTLEEMGPAAADALPGLCSALAQPDNDHAGRYMVAAIKAIDPSSPKPLFERDEMLATLRGLSETVAELGPVLSPPDLEAVTEFIDDSSRFTPEQLADRARQLAAIHPRLRQVFVGELLKLDPALETVLEPGALSPAH